MPGAFFVLLWILLFTCGCRMGDHQSPPRNVLLISIDTLRADHISCYGYFKPTTPAIDRLAHEGTMFTQNLAQRGQTWPSLTSILTSMYPQIHGVRENGQILDASIWTIAQYLQANDFATAAFLSNMHRAPHRGFDLKFLANTTKDQGLRDRQVSNAAMNWIRKNRNRPFFAWIHFLSPHKPYFPPSPFRERFGSWPPPEGLDASKETLDEIILNKTPLSQDELGFVISQYDGEIALVDSLVSEVLAGLEELGLQDHTLVILTADHGEELFQHHHYCYHSCSIYDSVLRVPLIFRLPHVVPSSKSVATVVESIDIAPTLFDFLGISLPSTFEGKSLKPLIVQDFDEIPVPFLAFSEIKEDIASIRTAHWRYIANPNRARLDDFTPYSSVDDERRNGYAIQEQELYDLRNDPDEMQNLAFTPHGREIIESLKPRLAAWRAQGSATAPQEEMDPATLEELRSLGYIQ